MENFAKRLKQLRFSFVSTNFVKVKFNVAFKAPSEIGKHFPFKDNIKHVESRSLVVYKINCTQCDASYIGKTERILTHRISEHQKQPTSACHQHCQSNPGHRMDYENIEVLDSADNDFKLRIKEMLHIVRNKPELNKQLNAQSKYDIKTLIIAAYPQHSSSGVVAT